MRIVSSSVILLAVCAAVAAHASKLARGPVVDPQLVATVDAAALRIGNISAAQVADDTLYLAGRDGVAAVGADGKPLWVARLPHADVRSIDVDGTGIAVLSQNLAAAQPMDSVMAFFAGDLADLPTYKDSTLTLLDRRKHGAHLWTVPAGSSSRGAPPALSPTRVAFSDGWSLTVFNRKDGAAAGRAKTATTIGESLHKLAGLTGQGTATAGDVATKTGFGNWMYEAATRNRPLYLSEAFFSGFFSELSKVDAANAKEIAREGNYGLGVFQNITSGPVHWGERLVFGTAPGDNSNSLLTNKAGVFVADANAADVWHETVDDRESGVASLAVRGDRLYAATNFTLTAFDAKGNTVWDAETAKSDGALAISQYRGVRYYNGNFAMRPGPGFCMAADDKYLYLSSSEFNTHPSELQRAGLFKVSAKAGGRELITVLDAAKGKYLTSIDAKGRIVDLLIVGPSLAVIDFDQVRFIRPPQ